MTTATTDEAVMELLIKVQRQKVEIKTGKKTPHWRTNCTIGFDPSKKLSAASGEAHDMINIRVARESKLIEIWAFLLQRENYQSKAANDLSLPDDKMYMGYLFSGWKEDLKFRAEQLSVERKQKEVAELDARVNKLVTPEQRRVMEIEAIQKMLSD